MRRWPNWWENKKFPRRGPHKGVNPGHLVWKALDKIGAGIEATPEKIGAGVGATPEKVVMIGRGYQDRDGG